jgi:hypothetical protein
VHISWRGKFLSFSGDFEGKTNFQSKFQRKFPFFFIYSKIAENSEGKKATKNIVARLSNDRQPVIGEEGADGVDRVDSLRLVRLRQI